MLHLNTTDTAQKVFVPAPYLEDGATAYALELTNTTDKSAVTLQATDVEEEGFLVSLTLAVPQGTLYPGEWSYSLRVTYGTGQGAVTKREGWGLAMVSGQQQAPAVYNAENEYKQYEG